jgi:hypothetical protein
MSCGYEFVPKDTTDAVAGNMQEIFIGSGQQKKKLADSAKHLWDQICTYARFHSQPQYQKGRAWHLYKQITGLESPYNFSISPNVEITTNTYNKIQSMNIAYNRKKR